MRSRSLVAAVVMLVCGAGSAFAQALSLEFRDGRVRLSAENVPVSRVLEEWTRVGGTRIVHGEQIPGAALTLQIVDVPEQQALDIVLRGAAGYMAVARSTPAPGASTLEKILVLPTTTRVAAATAPPPQQPVPPAAQFFPRPDQEPVEPDENGPGLPAPVGGFPRGRVPGPPLNVPTSLPANAQPPLSDDSDDSPNAAPTQQASPGNPFGVVPGGARPGTITPPPQQQNPNLPQGQVPARPQPQQAR